MKVNLKIFVLFLTITTAFAESPPKGNGLNNGKAVDEKEHAAPEGVEIKNLWQHWVHSREEEKGSNAKEKIFRPAKSKVFPPSRFRMAYRFSPDGNCESMFLHPTDRHGFKPGKWEIDESDKTVLKIIDEGKTLSFRIVELSKDVLRLAPVEPNR